MILWDSTVNFNKLSKILSKSILQKKLKNTFDLIFLEKRGQKYLKREVFAKFDIKREDRGHKSKIKEIEMLDMRFY